MKKHPQKYANGFYLMGFSMGGAGAWHIGAHHTDRFAGIHAGAGFAVTGRAELDGLFIHGITARLAAAA